MTTTPTGGFITTGASPYLSSLSCIWRITCTNSTDVLHFNGSIDTEKGYDFLKIDASKWDGEMGGTDSSSSLPPLDTFVMAPTAIVSFTSDSIGQARGVNLSWACVSRSELPPPETPAPPKPNVEYTNNSILLRSVREVKTLAPDPALTAGLGSCYDYMTKDFNVYGITQSCVVVPPSPITTKRRANQSKNPTNNSNTNQTQNNNSSSNGNQIDDDDDDDGFYYQENNLPSSVLSLAVSDYGEMYVFWNVSGNMGQGARDYTVIYLEELFECRGGAGEFYVRISFSEDCSMIAASVWDRIGEGKNSGGQGQGGIYLYDVSQADLDVNEAISSQSLYALHYINMSTELGFNQTNSDARSMLSSFEKNETSLSEFQSEMEVLMKSVCGVGLDGDNDDESESSGRNCNAPVLGKYEVPSPTQRDTRGYKESEHRKMSVFSASFSYVGKDNFILYVAAMTKVQSGSSWSTSQLDYYFTLRSFNLTKKKQEEKESSGGKKKTNEVGLAFLHGEYFFQLYFPVQRVPPTLSRLNHFFVLQEEEDSQGSSSVSTTTSPSPSSSSANNSSSSDNNRTTAVPISSSSSSNNGTTTSSNSTSTPTGAPPSSTPESPTNAPSPTANTAPSSSYNHHHHHYQVLVFCVQYFDFVEVAYTEYECDFIKFDYRRMGHQNQNNKDSQNGSSSSHSNYSSSSTPPPPVTFWTWDFSATFPQIVQYNRGSSKFATTMGSIGGAVLDYSKSCVALFSLTDSGIAWKGEEVHLLDIFAEDTYCVNGMIKRLELFSPGRFLLQETSNCYGECLYPVDPDGLLACDPSDANDCKSYLLNDAFNTTQSLIGVPPWPNYYSLMIDQVHVIGEENYLREYGGGGGGGGDRQQGGGSVADNNNSTVSSTDAGDSQGASSSSSSSSSSASPMAPFLSHLPDYTSNRFRMKPVVITKTQIPRYACSGQWQVILLLGGDRAILAIWSVDKLEYKHGYYQLWRTSFLIEGEMNVTSASEGDRPFRHEFEVGYTTVGNLHISDLTTGTERTIHSDADKFSFHISQAPLDFNPKTGLYEIQS